MSRFFSLILRGFTTWVEVTDPADVVFRADLNAYCGIEMVQAAIRDQGGLVGDLLIGDPLAANAVLSVDSRGVHWLTLATRTRR